MKYRSNSIKYTKKKKTVHFFSYIWNSLSYVDTTTRISRANPFDSFISAHSVLVWFDLKSKRKKKKTLLRCWTWEKCKLTTTMARSMWMRSFYFIYFLLFISYNQLCGLRRYRCNGMRIYMYGLQERYKEEEKTHAVIATQLNANEENKERKR